MPQLDPSSFPSQLLWLAFTFCLLYFVMAKSALPRIAGILQSRREKILSDLEQADSLRLDAESLEAECERALDKNRKKAHAMIADAADEAKKRSAERNAQLDDKLFAQEKKAKDALFKAKSEAVSELSLVSSGLTRLIVKNFAGLQVDAKQSDDVVNNIIANS